MLFNTFIENVTEVTLQCTHKITFKKIKWFPQICTKYRLLFSQYFNALKNVTEINPEYKQKNICFII